MKEIAICTTMGVSGHLIVYQGIVPGALLHTLVIWGLIGLCLYGFSSLIARLRR